VELVWTLRARADLEEIITYIAEDSPDAAEGTAEYILSAVAQLRDQPGLGRPGRKEGTRELVVRKASWSFGFIIPYRVRRERVELLAVIHSARH
jgi:toxin ParE1/3/4